MTTRKKPSKLPPGVQYLESSGRFRGRYHVMINGRRVEKSTGTYATARDAADARTVELLKVKHGTWVDPAGPKATVADWAEQWLGLHPHVSANIRSFVRHHIVPAFGDRRLGDITSLDVQGWVNDLSASGLAPGTVRAVYATLQRMMGYAVDHDRLARTPCRTIRLPRIPRAKRSPISAADIRAIIAAMPACYRAMVELAAWAGLRWQECAALRWENVDLEAQTLTICEAVKSKDRKVGTTKSDRVRVVHLDDGLTEVLRAHRRDFGGAGLLFTAPRFDGQLDYSSFRRRVWLPAVQASGVTPEPTFHKLRHAFIGHMAKEGVDFVVISEEVGHHSPSFTADTYGWARADAAEVMRAAVSRARQG